MSGVQDALRSLIEDKRRFVQELFLLEDKERHIIPFRFNPIQERIWDAIYEPGSHVVNCKPSQIGASTLIIALFLADTITVPGTTSVIVAHEDFITQRLLQKAQFFYDNLPPEFKPVMTHKSANEKFFPEINSVMYIGSARAYVFGRGEVIHNFLADEYGFWPDPERIMVPALQRVPVGGRFVVNSTPNGQDNAFCEIYTNAKSGKSNWRPVFSPWFMHPEYRLPQGHPSAPRGDRGSLANLDSAELALMAKGVDEDQLRWRRFKIAEVDSLRLNGKTRLLFGQEFPEDDVSCFLSAGDMVYDERMLAKLRRECFDAPSYLDVQSYSNLPLLIWEEPVEGQHYILACDPGQGKTTRSAITIWRYEDDPDDTEGLPIPVHCATHVSHNETRETAKDVAAIGRYYNYALAVVEANSHGVAVINELQNLKYYHLYNREDILTKRASREVGWLTTPKTKPYMIKEGQKLLSKVVLHDAQIISEFGNVRYVNGQVDTVGLDDLHMSCIMNFCCRGEALSGVGFVGVGGWGAGWGEVRGRRRR